MCRFYTWLCAAAKTGSNQKLKYIYSFWFDKLDTWGDAQNCREAEKREFGGKRKSRINANQGSSWQNFDLVDTSELLERSFSDFNPVDREATLRESFSEGWFSLSPLWDIRCWRCRMTFNASGKENSNQFILILSYINNTFTCYQESFIKELSSPFCCIKV